MILVVIAESEVVLTGIIDVLFCLTVAFVKPIPVNVIMGSVLLIIFRSPLSL